MTPLPAALERNAALIAWRIDALRHADTWDSGIGAERLGGRWNPKGTPAVYCSFDPATCLIEAAVHRGFAVLDTQPHLLTRLEITDGNRVRVVGLDEIPNPAWLSAGIPIRHQQQWGAALLAQHAFVVFPSAVSKPSWNVVFDPGRARGAYRMRVQQRLSVDTRIQPAT